MHSAAPRTHLLAMLLATSLGCQRSTPSALAGDWTLVELGGEPAPPGAGNRAATLRFQADSGRATGFAGCNRLGASYAVSDESLRFGAALLTRMACPEGMDLERKFTDALTATTRYQVTGTELILSGVSGPLARFVRSTP